MGTYASIRSGRCHRNGRKEPLGVSLDPERRSAADARCGQYRRMP